MITNIHIENFKSIPKLDLELGRFNVIIGENGCGKTNVLEAIAFASAANQGLLNNEYLGSKLRVTQKEFMLPAFPSREGSDTYDIISVDIEDPTKIKTSVLCAYSPKENQWVNMGEMADDLRIITLSQNSSFFKRVLKRVIIKAGEDIQDVDIEQLKHEIDAGKVDFIKKKIPTFYNTIKSLAIEKPLLNRFVVFCPEETKLRRFSEETQVLPIGRRGEGLFQYLKLISEDSDGLSILSKIQEGLALIEWFDGIHIPEDLLSNEYKLDVADKYLKESLHYFDQRSTNEGFLYLLIILLCKFDQS